MAETFPVIIFKSVKKVKLVPYFGRIYAYLCGLEERER